MKKWIIIFLFISLSGLLFGCTNDKSVEESTGSDEGIKIHLTRHGRTIFNTMDHVQGWSDTPLTEEGKEVAVDLGKGLAEMDLDAIYSSDAGRSIETAEIIIGESGHELELDSMHHFREMYFGKYEGLPNPVMWDDIMDLIGADDMNDVMTGGYQISDVINAVSELDETGEAETWDEITNRLEEGLGNIVSIAKDEGHKEIIVVTHGMAIASILEMIDSDQGIVHVGNSSISTIKYFEDDYSILGIDDMKFVEKGRAE